MLQGRERDLRNENASLNIYSFISKERGIISTQIGRGDYYVLGILNVLNFFEIFEIKVLNMLPH